MMLENTSIYEGGGRELELSSANSKWYKLIGMQKPHGSTLKKGQKRWWILLGIPGTNIGLSKQSLLVFCAWELATATRWLRSAGGMGTAQTRFFPPSHLPPRPRQILGHHSETSYLPAQWDDIRHKGHGSLGIRTTTFPLLSKEEQ